jgi:hypothetical protein
MPFIFPTAEELEPIVLELELDVESLERLAIYSGLMAYTTDSESEEARLGYLRDNLPKWAEWEQETYYGHHNTPEDFVMHYLDNYVEYEIPGFICIDYEGTWDRNLRHDFHFDYDSGHVWAEVY